MRGMKYSGSLFPLLLAGILAAVTFWLQQVAEPGGVDRSGRLRHDPDYIVEKFSVRRFNADGKLQHTLTAPFMSHYPDDDSTVLTSPQIVFHGTPPSRLSGNTAHVSKDAKEVVLDGNVNMVRAGVDAPDTVVSTARLNIFPDDEIARSESAVTITKGLTVINGTGLAMDNKTSTTQLFGPVRGIIYRNNDSSRKAP
jgi:lipopolysaccharide export system protein LptC